MSPERALELFRDGACLGVAIGGIVHQQLTGNVSEALLVVYTALLGIPTYAHLKAAKPRDGGSTPASSSSSAHSPPPTGSPSISPSASGGEG